MQSKNENLEIEVKFFLNDPQFFHQRLVEIGAQPGPRVFETNFRYENAANSLRSEGILLRLRQDQTCRLTVKTKPPHDDPDFKVHAEWEVEVNDYNAIAAILSQLGFHVAQVYEKWRQTFDLENCVACLDTMPYGDFLEIEGGRRSIRTVAERLGLPWQTRILDNYLTIFEIVRKHEGIAFNDLTFANFTERPVTIAPYISLCYAG